jgi:hypothetical protein
MNNLNGLTGEPTRNPLGMDEVASNHVKVIHFFIDKSKFETTKSSLTVREILEDFAKVSSTNNTLAVKEAGNFVEFTDLNLQVELKEGEHFTVFNNEPTPVS